MAKLDIQNFRDAIDAIDDKIVALFNERSLIVKNVGVTKKKYLENGECYIRSGREAEVIHRIRDKFTGGVFPAGAAMQMWRTVICASLSLESALNISVCESNSEIYWLAREYFGNFLTITRRKNSAAVIKDITGNKVQVGVFAINEGRWWLNIPKDLKVFGCVPFIIRKNEKINTLAVARLEPEKTEDDLTIMKLTVKGKKKVNIVRILGKYGLKVHLLDKKGNHYLAEAKGFITEQDAAAIAKETGFAITVLGAYAVPVRI